MVDGHSHPELVVDGRARPDSGHAAVDEDEGQALLLELVDELVGHEDAGDEEPVDPPLEQKPAIRLAA